MTRLPKNLAEDMAKFIPVPPHITVAANMCRYDLMHGPAYARLPSGDVVKITYDDLTILYADAEASLEPGSADEVVEVYTSVIGDTLRDFINDLPSTLYYDADCGCIMDLEPEGEEWDTGEVDADGDPIMQWSDPSDYWTLDRRDIVEALFGRTIAHEFN